MNPKTPLETSALGVRTLGVLVAAATLALYAMHGSLPHNPLHLPLEAQLETNVWAPESWKFFTRDPQEANPVALRPDGDGWVSATRMPYARPRNLFGMDRAVRAQGVEIGQLLRTVPAAAWTPCDEAKATCLSRASAGVRVINKSPLPSLCGTVGIVAEKLVPWAWASSRRPVVMPSHVVRLDVQC